MRDQVGDRLAEGRSGSRRSHWDEWPPLAYQVISLSRKTWSILALHCHAGNGRHSGRSGHSATSRIYEYTPRRDDAHLSNWSPGLVNGSFHRVPALRTFKSLVLIFRAAGIRGSPHDFHAAPAVGAFRFTVTSEAFGHCLRNFNFDGLSLASENSHSKTVPIYFECRIIWGIII